MRVLLFTRSLDAGGAERQLVLLAKSLHSRGVPVAVMVYYGSGPFRSDLDEAGVPVLDLKKSGRWDFAAFGLRTIEAIRKYRPDVIYTFIGAHLVASALWLLIGRPPIFWGVRASQKDMSKYDSFIRTAHRLSIAMSRFARGIICNSNAGRDYIESIGYKNKNIKIISNGIDTARFRSDPNKRLSQRNYWSLKDHSPLIGVVARIDIVKDHSSFIKAAARVLNEHPNARFVCVGDGDPELLMSLKNESIQLGLSDKLIWAGHSNNPVADYSALDVLVLPSMTEGFPNVVVEAMTCGLPVVATDVGDCRRIVGDCGWIVPPKNPEALAATISEAIYALPTWSAERSRKRIQENFSVDAMVDQTLSVLDAAVKP
jgi:glycosyltransferase involved in cell wall biosynthesis